jgi:uncharacterized protein (DUF342 family)
LAPNDPRTEDTPEIFSDDDYGIIDYIEIYEARVADMNSAITLINEATVRVGEQLNQRSVEINSGIAIDPKLARRLIKRAADDMNIYADTLNSQVSLLSTSRKVAFDSLTNSLALRGEFRDQEQDLHTLRQTLASLIDSTSAAKSGMSGMRAAANGLPRISKELNQAKRSVVSRLDLFLSEIDSISSTVANIVEAIDRMLGDASGQ